MSEIELVTLPSSVEVDECKDGVMSDPEEILTFWLDDVGEEGWYKQSDDLDAEIKSRFERDYERACEGALSLWLTYPSGTLAYIILMDQFPRNMFRGMAKSFEADPVALAAAKMAIEKGWDHKIDPPGRQFFYLPLMHSECLVDQDRAVRLISSRMDNDAGGNLVHAKAHREVIRLFGRFPHRNEALGRETPKAEAEFLANGGYGATVRALQGTEVG